jgi:hypothetical protein
MGPPPTMKPHPRIIALAAAFLSLQAALFAQVPTVPDWAQPGSATHKQVPPPVDFHRPSVSFATPLGLFEGQSDIGGPVLAGHADYDTASGRYTIASASYNIWYTRDEFRYLWKKVSGDLSLAADIAFPNPGGYGDRKVVLVIRQDLDDDSKEVMVALHGAGLIHLAQRPTKGANIKEAVRIPASAAAGSQARRLGIEKHGDQVTLYVSEDGGPLHPSGQPVTLPFDRPFYVGIGFCSHQPTTMDTAVVSNVVYSDKAGLVR